MTMRLLLLSNSTNHGGGYLDHAEALVREHFGSVRRVLFVPFALRDQAGYTAKVEGRLKEMGFAVEALAEGPGAPAALARAEGIFVGGGNTFRLLDRLRRSGALEALRARASDGVPYMGASAGTVIAAPTIRTTNDMPIVEPGSLSSLGLLPFQINAHYIDADPASQHMGETRELRLEQFLEENDVAVLGLREGGILIVDGPPGRPAHVRLAGTAGGRIFRRGAPPIEVAVGEDVAQRLA
jgi:dipeptidase E